MLVVCICYFGFVVVCLLSWGCTVVCYVGLVCGFDSLVVSVLFGDLRVGIVVVDFCVLIVLAACVLVTLVVVWLQAFGL